MDFRKLDCQYCFARYGSLRFPSATTAAVAALLLGVSPAFADDRPNPAARVQAASKPELAGALPEGIGVLDRARPEYDAAGLAVGTFILYPTVAAGFSVDDNVYRTTSAATADLFWTISPRLDLRSQWARDRLQVYAQLDDYRYDSYGTENRTNWVAGGGGDVLVGPATTVNINASYLGTHESRTSPDISVQALSPTAYRQFHSDATILNQPASLGLSAGLTFDRYDYDATLLRGGGLLGNADRDSNVLEAFGKASYEFGGGRSVFARASYNVRDFDQTFDRNGFNHNSNGYRIDTGVQAMFSPLIKGTLFVGYLQQNFKAPLNNVSGIDFGSEIDWYVTELVTVHLSTARILTNTTLAGASSEDERSIHASFDYELLRNVIVQGSLGYENDIFDGIARRDHTITAGIETKYLITQQMSLYAGFTHAGRDSNFGAANFSDDIGTAGIRLQY